MDCQAPEVHESRLFETVRLIREWIEGSFEPSQEERFNRTGKLKARFDVDLGSQMCEQLKLYAKASFALSKLQFQLIEREVPGKRPRPCVEVALSAAARQLYAEKHPEAVAKRRAVLPALPDGAEGSEATRAASTPALAAGAQRPALADAKAAGPAKSTEAPGAGAAAAPAGSQAAKPTTPRRAKRPLESAVSEEPPPGKRGAAAPPSSVWEAVVPREVPPGLEALRQAKDALDAGLCANGGLSALKAEKEAVAWLKGLASCSVGAVELRETLIGQAVNAWRKHKEPYISSLALSLLRTWKAAWREAESESKKRAPSSTQLAITAK